jgi:hypothetical protein
MKTKITTIAALVAFTALPVFAQGVNVSAGATVNTSGGGNTVQAGASAKLQARITKAQQRADQEIDRRNRALNTLNTRVQAMSKVSGPEKSAIATAVQNEISNLTSLKVKIDADTDINTVKTDIKSITAGYRIFMLVIPEGNIEVAGDKIHTVADVMITFSLKLQTRISAAQSAGKDVAALSASLADMNAKIADAKVQADAAVALVANLTPDSGDTTKMQANNQSLADARGKIKLAMSDLQAARQDVNTILKGLKSINASASSTTQIQQY